MNLLLWHALTKVPPSSSIEALTAELAEYRAAIIGGRPDPKLNKGNFLEMIHALHRAREGAVVRAEMAEAEVARVTSDRQYIIGFNAGWNEAVAAFHRHSVVEMVEDGQ